MNEQETSVAAEPPVDYEAECYRLMAGLHRIVEFGSNTKSWSGAVDIANATLNGADFTFGEPQSRAPERTA